MNIEELKREESYYNELLSENRNKQRELNKIEFIKKHGFNIGDIVKWSDSKKGKIIRIEFSGVNPNYYIVSLFNSDGKLGKRETIIWYFDFKSISLVNE